MNNYDKDYKNSISLSRMTLFVASYMSNCIRDAADAFGIATRPQKKMKHM